MVTAGVPGTTRTGRLLDIGTSVDITERSWRKRLASQKLIEAQEEEKTRIARELHDDISQRIALLGLHLGTLKRVSASATDLSKRFGKCTERSGTLRRIFRRCRTAFTPRDWNSWGCKQRWAVVRRVIESARRHD